MEKEKNKKRFRWIIPVVILVIVAAVLGYGGMSAYSRAKALKRQATELKEDLKAVISCLAGLDTDGADQALVTMDQDIDAVRKVLEEPLWRFAAKVPKVGTEIDTASALVDLLAETSDEILKPAVEILREYPLSALREGGGFNMAMIEAYIAFFGEMVPKLETIASSMSTMELHIVDPDGKLMQYMQQFVVIADLASEAKTELLDPLVKQMEETPLSQLKTEKGFNARTMVSYMDFAEAIMPKIEGFAQTVHATDFSLLDDGGRIDGYLGKLDSLLDLYEENKSYLPLLRMILGDGSDRYYVIVAQNSAEIRASGGFPGSFGNVQIKDGAIEIGDFSKTHDHLKLYPPYDLEEKMAGKDTVIFGEWVEWSWDAGLCPDFERVGKIWAACYEDMHDLKVDGMISMTPSVIQDLLAVYGEVVLSDGTVIDGTNATRMLQHDLYYQYHGRENFVDDSFLDALFEETAKATMAKVLSGFSVRQLIELMDIFKKDTADRTIMFWFADEKAEELCREMGCSGGLNKDAKHPVAGIYFSDWTSSKMGWFADIDYEVSDPVTRVDGTQSYEVTAYFTNVITPEEYAAGSWYIVGGYGDGMLVNIHLFAPMGGTIENVEFSRDIYYGTTEYDGLQVVYLVGYILSGQETLSVSYTITTAPNPESPLTFSTTPTLQEYRE